MCWKEKAEEFSRREIQIKVGGGGGDCIFSFMDGQVQIEHATCNATIAQVSS